MTPRRDTFAPGRLAALAASKRRLVLALAGWVFAMGWAPTVSPAQGVVASGWSNDPYQMVTPAGGLGFAGNNVAGVVPVNFVGSSGSAALGAPAVNSAVAPAGLFHPPLLQNGPLQRHFSSYSAMLPNVSAVMDARVYFFADFLLWDVDGMDTPPLVTTSPVGTAATSAGVLGQSGTSSVFGPGTLNDGTVGGLRVGGGMWLTPSRNLAIETEFIALGEGDDGFHASSPGTPILARPYFNTATGQEAARGIAYPGLLSGGILIASESDFRSFLLNARVSLCPVHGAGCQHCGTRDRTDLVIGYRHAQLRDTLDFFENIDVDSAVANRSLHVHERFRTTNEFHGVQLGVVRRSLLTHRAWLESMLRVAFGNNRQELNIHGGTAITDSGTRTDYTGGLYAQGTNIGDHQRDSFVMIPELGARLGVRLTDRLHATVGYSVLYFPNVIRASEQIDRDVNPNQIPVATLPLTGAPRPRLLWSESEYVAHGVSFGGELHF